MDWLKGFTYIFEDKNWAKKMFIGSLVTSVPVAESITNGYQLEVIENLKNGYSQPLPEWSNMDKKFSKGFKLWLCVNLFYIPSIIISFISWFLGIPLVMGLIINFLASSATDNHLKARGIAYLLGYVVLPLIEIVITGIAVFLGSILLPAVFFFVPAMALRFQETGSIASTLNLFAHIKFVLKNLGDYVISRFATLGMMIGMEILASMLGGITVWIAGLGVLVAWFIFNAGRFWSRLAWAYFLANMRMKEQSSNNNFRLIKNEQSSPIGMNYQRTYPLT